MWFLCMILVVLCYKNVFKFLAGSFSSLQELDESLAVKSDENLEQMFFIFNWMASRAL